MAITKSDRGELSEDDIYMMREDIDKTFQKELSIGAIKSTLDVLVLQGWLSCVQDRMYTAGPRAMMELRQSLADMYVADRDDDDDEQAAGARLPICVRCKMPVLLVCNVMHTVMHREHLVMFQLMYIV